MIYTPNNYEIARTEDKIASVYASSGDYKKAAEYVKSALNRICMTLCNNIYK